MTLLDAVENFPMEKINEKAPNVSYTFWHLLEHIRITQLDILDFCVNKNYQEIKWPDKYWPKKDKLATASDWEKSIKEFKKDTKKMVALLEDEKTDLFSKISWGQGQTILREAMLIADHNAYHIGEFAILRQVTNSWPKER